MLAGRVALITGSTSGIGLGIAKQLAASGADIVLNGFGDSAEIENLVKSFRDGYKVKVDYDPADLMKVDQIESMINKRTSGSAHERSIDILVNNAGIQHVSRVEHFPSHIWNAVLDINLSAVYHTTRLVLPHMQKRNWGRIINIASVHGLVASQGKAAYVAAKHGVVGLTKVTALENATTGVTCNAICPGWVLTPLVQQQIDRKADLEGISKDEAKSRLLSEKQPSGQFVMPSQLGDLAVFLCSDSASEVRGVAWNMDGGWVAQ